MEATPNEEQRLLQPKSPKSAKFRSPTKVHVKKHSLKTSVWDRVLVVVSVSIVVVLIFTYAGVFSKKQTPIFLPKELVLLIQKVFAVLNIPKDIQPEENQLALSLIVTLTTLSFSYMFVGRRRQKRAEALRMELQDALARVEELETKLDEVELEELKGEKNLEKKEIRVWMDGAFDMFHYGHMNAFRQGRALGTYLVVGVNDDASITSCKGTAPVLNDEERIGSVKGCRWVDEIVPHCPYVMSPEYLDKVIKQYNIDYVVHGDDPCIVDGKDVYQDAKDRGIYREISRTTGVSTTDIVGRMLITTSRDHHDRSRESPLMGSLMSGTKVDKFTRRSKFLTTGRMIRIFSQECKEPKPTDRIVYIDGAWDMFHVGHIETLKAAKELGDFLIVGVYNDDLVNSHRGGNYPIMNLNERVLSVLGCRHVDDVLIDAPWEITREMISALNIKVVASGSKRDCEDSTSLAAARDEFYRVPKSLGIYKEINSQAAITVEDIVSRILAQEVIYTNKLKKKTKAENEYYTQRYGFDVTAVEENEGKKKLEDELTPLKI